MKTRGALLWEPGTNSGWSIEEIDLDAPADGEVLVELTAAGLCHTDHHYDTGDSTLDFAPFLGGHEGAGIVQEVGSNVTGLEVGDHVVTTFMPVCGHCRYCTEGRGRLCERGGDLLSGLALDGTNRMRARGKPVGALAFTGTFAEHIVCPADSLIKIDKDIPLDKASLLACAVPTGWGSAVYLVDTRPGDIVVIIGTGGVGMCAVQGARGAGAQTIVAVDPVEWKRETARSFGATHTAASIDDARELVSELTNGEMADKAILVAGIVEGEMIDPALRLVSKGGVLGITGVSSMAQTAANLSIFEFVMYEKQIRGGLYGMTRPSLAIPMLVDLYRKGDLMLDELVTHTYSLDEINQGYKDMEDGKTLRGVVLYQ